MKKSIFTLVLLFFIIPFSFAQNNDFVIGLVLNQKTQEPIPFATIYLKGDNFGITSNENGTFKLPVNNFALKNTLIIRCIGYKTIELPLKEVPLNILTAFKLNEETYSLDEILIKEKKLKSPSPKEIVRTAIDNILNNYPSKPHLLKGYYRDYIKIDDQYLNMYESLLEIEDLGFGKSDYETSKIKKTYGRINDEFPFDSLKMLDYSDRRTKRIPSGEMGFKGGNELSILRLSDPVRNHERNNFDFINYLKTDFLDNHYFKIKDIIRENNKYYYVIQFKYSKKRSADLEVGSRAHVGVYNQAYYPETRADGLIYVGRDSYTIKKLIYTLYLKDRKLGELKGWELNLEYGDFNNKAYLNYISYNNVFEIADYSDSLYFYLKNVHVNIQEKRISLEFNNNLKAEIENDLNLFKIKFKNEKIDFWQVNADTSQKNVVHLYPESTDFIKKFGDFKPELAYLIKVNLPRNFSDVNGNRLNKYVSILGYQYREFFVQDIKLDYTPLQPEECLDKWKSLIDYKKFATKDSTALFFNSPIIYNSKEFKLLK